MSALDRPWPTATATPRSRSVSRARRSLARWRRRLAVQPFLGPVLNFFNRFVVPRVDVLAGYELFANLILAALGAVLVLTADRAESS
jgi:antibiotic biosynthesis monooxygenase (ABM) superfamily enzyme